MLLTDPEGDSCFTIHQVSWIKLKKVTFCRLKTSLSRHFVYNNNFIDNISVILLSAFYDFVANLA